MLSLVELELFTERRNKLCNRIKALYPNKKGILCLMADVEKERGLFRQESSFYYLSGLQDPGIMITVDLATGHTILFVPAYATSRAQWMDTERFDKLCETHKQYGFDEVRFLGLPVNGYTMHLLGSIEQYTYVASYVQSLLAEKNVIFSLFPDNQTRHVDQHIIWSRLCQLIPHLEDSVIDVDAEVAAMRRVKGQDEIEAIYEAIGITSAAQQAVAQTLSECKPDQIMNEAELHGLIRYVMTVGQATEAFPSIVGSGRNSTVLHYHANNRDMKNGDLVVVDIGAEKNMYCADITRTYPISGKFTPRQREIYNLVLQAQEYIASLAKPGLWLRNKDHPELSLQHLAKEFFRKEGCDHYFPHGIGHYLGLDVHDVGDYTVPLAVGDVFTIEPGIYIKEESLGVRIEDNYLMTKDGVVCLSYEIPKTVEEVEAFMAGFKQKG